VGESDVRLSAYQASGLPPCFSKSANLSAESAKLANLLHPQYPVAGRPKTLKLCVFRL
jgi:hypothetical protein